MTENYQPSTWRVLLSKRSKGDTMFRVGNKKKVGLKKKKERNYYFLNCPQAPIITSTTPCTPMHTHHKTLHGIPGIPTFNLTNSWFLCNTSVNTHFPPRSQAQVAQKQLILPLQPHQFMSHPAFLEKLRTFSARNS